MINPTDYEAIGRLARDYYVAEVERVNARNQRKIARESHPCISEKYPNESPCWTSPDNDPNIPWCDNCKYVQPFYETYRLAARKTSAARYKMTRRIQAKMLSEAEE